MALIAMRKNVARLVTQIFLILIILSFFVWGINFNTGSNQQSREVASVGNVKINAPEYLRTLSNTAEILLQNGRINNIEIDQLNKLNIPQNVINDMVNQALIENLINENKLDVTDEYILAKIQQNPALQTNGKFNKNTFSQILKANNLSSEQYLEIVKKDIITDQYINSITNEIKNQKIFQTILKTYLYDNIDIEYIILGKNDLLDTAKKITPDELQQYYQNNQNQFLEPEYRKIGYVKIDQDDIKEFSKTSPEEIKNFYKANQDRYRFDESREIEQIIFPDKQKAELAYKKIKNEQDFYQIALEAGFTKKQLSIGIKTKKQILDKNLADTAFKLQENQISKPTNVNFGAAIIKVKTIIPAKIYSLEDETQAIKQEILDDKKRQALAEYIDQFEQERQFNSSIKDIAKKIGFQYQDSNFINSAGIDKQNKSVINNYITPVTVKNIFQTDIDVENDFIDLFDGGALWFEVIDIQKSKAKTLPQVQEQIRQILKTQQEYIRIENLATKIEQSLSLDPKIEKIALKYNKSITVVKNLSRNQIKNRIPAKMFAKIFETKKNEFGKYLQIQDQMLYIYKVTKKNKYQEKNIPQEQNDIIKNYSVISQQEIISNLLNSIRKKYPVKIDQEAIQNILQNLN